MLATIDLDHKLAFETHEVEDVGAERELSAKLDAIKPAIAQEKPKLSLCISCEAPHRASIRALARSNGLMMRCVWNEPLTELHSLTRR